MKRSLARSTLLFPGAACASCFLAACGPPSAPTAPPTATSARHSVTSGAGATSDPSTQDPAKGPDGEVVGILGHRVEITFPSGSVRGISAEDLRAAPGDRSLLGISPTSVLYLANSIVLVGMADGTVVGVDGGGHKKYSIGFRGAIRGFQRTKDSLVAVTTDRGVMALLTGEGKLVWEKQVTGEAFYAPILTRDGTIVAASQRGVFAMSPAGELLFSHAGALLPAPCHPWEAGCDPAAPPVLYRDKEEIVAGEMHFRAGDPHPPVPSLVPTFPLTFRKVLSGTVTSILPTGGSEVSALVTTRTRRTGYGDWEVDDPFELVQIDGSKQKRLPLPAAASKKQVFVKGQEATKASLFYDALVAGPNGNPWILARRIHSGLCGFSDGEFVQFGGAGQILEVTGGKIAERSDLFQQFFEHWLHKPVAAAGQGTASVFCYGGEAPVCSIYDGAQVRTLTPPHPVTAVTPVGDAVWLLDQDGFVARVDARKVDTYQPLQRPGSAHLRSLGGASEKDVWAGAGNQYSLYHWDGAAWSEVAVPLEGKTLTARAMDDVWNGRSHWDGKRWAIVHGAPAATSVIVKSKDDVWMGGDSGLWHGTSPGPAVVDLPPAPVTGDGAISPPPALTLGPPEADHTATRASVDLTGEAPLTTARSLSAAADGTLWLTEWDRVVELGTDGKATTRRYQGSNAASRWAYPLSKGRGLFLEDEVRLLDGGSVTTGDVQLDGHALLAVNGHPQGATWIVGSTSWADFSPHALVRDAKDTAFRLVQGLPAASWCDISATPDGGAWLAGGLSPGPLRRRHPLPCQRSPRRRKLHPFPSPGDPPLRLRVGARRSLGRGSRRRDHPHPGHPDHPPDPSLRRVAPLRPRRGPHQRLDRR